VTDTEFVRASRLYDVRTGERVEWDWSGHQSVEASQKRVDRAVSEGAGDAGD